jgi:hypothetical protein
MEESTEVSIQFFYFTYLDVSPGFFSENVSMSRAYAAFSNTHLRPDAMTYSNLVV